MRVKNILFSAFILGAAAMPVTAQTKIDQDRAAIKALAGFYEVNFNYAETFAPASDYKFHDRYESHGNEWAVIVEESPKKIVIQHILALGDSMIVKHWREDWTYEDPDLYAYDKDNSWKKVALKPDDYKGKWTQKVYQVDDSPRYQGIGTWVHVDGQHRWQSETDSPLPRRETSKRSDYNVLRRLNRITFTPEGWMFEQDNEKILRTESGDKLVAREKGYEEFTKIEAKPFTYAQQWWADQGPFWKDVRDTWTTVFAANPNLTLALKVDNKLLYEKLFVLSDRSVKEKWTSDANKKAVGALIAAYLGKS